MKKGLTKLLSALLAAALLLCGAVLPASAAMTDIGGHWGEPAIQYCLDNSYMNGMSDTIFQPNGPVSRAMVVQVLYNLSGKPGVSGLANPFTDSQTHWAKDAIKWGSSTGVVKGMSDTTFAPETTVTRAQAATMFMRYAAQDTSNTHNDFTVDTSVLTLYPDRGQIASWYEEGVAWAVQYGFMQGSGGKLDPAGTLTRAQLAQFIQNYFQPKEGVQPPAPSDKYPTVEAFLEDPEVREQLQSILDTIDTQGMGVEIYGDEDTLYYAFTFPENMLVGVDLEILAETLEEYLMEDSIADIFIAIAESLSEVVDTETPTVNVSCYTHDDTWICGVDYFGY